MLTLKDSFNLTHDSFNLTHFPSPNELEIISAEVDSTFTVCLIY